MSLNTEPQSKSPRKANRDDTRHEIRGTVGDGMDEKGEDLYKVRWDG